MKIRMSKDITQIVKFCFIGGTNTIIGSIRESIRLPKTIPLSALELLLTTIYKQCKMQTPYTGDKIPRAMPSLQTCSFQAVCAYQSFVHCAPTMSTCTMERYSFTEREARSAAFRLEMRPLLTF